MGGSWFREVVIRARRSERGAAPNIFQESTLPKPAGIVRWAPRGASTRRPGAVALLLLVAGITTPNGGAGVMRGHLRRRTVVGNGVVPPPDHRSTEAASGITTSESRSGRSPSTSAMAAATAGASKLPDPGTRSYLHRCAVSTPSEPAGCSCVHTWRKAVDLATGRHVGSPAEASLLDRGGDRSCRPAGSTSPALPPVARLGLEPQHCDPALAVMAGCTTCGGSGPVRCAIS